MLIKQLFVQHISTFQTALSHLSILCVLSNPSILLFTLNWRLLLLIRIICLECLTLTLTFLFPTWGIAIEFQTSFTCIPCMFAVITPMFVRLLTFIEVSSSKRRTFRLWTSRWVTHHDFLSCLVSPLFLKTFHK